jgi:ssDNA-binding Zn-finger/Zn-ribbon topoisomerase 1
MSWTIKYKCSQCGYTTDIYQGKGFMGQEIISISCQDCKSIQPLIKGGAIGQVAPSYNSLIDRLCLQCGSKNIKTWDGKTCPKCNSCMHPTGEKEFWT